MDKNNRPRGREKNVTGGGMGVHKRGEGLHSGGPVGKADGYAERGGQGGNDKGLAGDIIGGPVGNVLGGLVEQGLEEVIENGLSQHSANQQSGQNFAGQNFGGQQQGGMFGGGQRRRGCSPGCLIVIAIAAFLLLGGGGLIGGNLMGYDNGISDDHTLYTNYSNSGAQTGGWYSGSAMNEESINYGANNSGTYSGGNTGYLNTSVAGGARAKRTNIIGNGQDTMTIMVYMCGTDLEQKGGMATSDLQEMARANIADNVNLIVYTGGCRGWRNNVVSSRVNQIYQIKNGNLIPLVQDAGDDAMTNPNTLTGYIQWCAKNFPSSRNELILWDHGGGSISGYGYDQRHTSSGSMTLAGIDQALKNSGVTFDFIGFDACLMATMENALMLSRYGDYLIASEETEPGTGWYYTNWLNAVSQNTSVPTTEIGKIICDDFVSASAQSAGGQSTTLSVVDLAEIETTEDDFSMFAQSIGKLIQDKKYNIVSNARAGAKEFARSSGIDQVDLIHLAKNLNTPEAGALVKVLNGAVKYNRTSRTMANSYGISIYFPYDNVRNVDSVVRTYKQIGMDEDYTRCIQEFAGLEVGGQSLAGGTGNPLGSLLGPGGGGAADSDMISEILGSLMGGSASGISGLDASNSGFLTESARVIEENKKFLEDNRFDPEDLEWKQNKEGQTVLKLRENQWDMIGSVELNMFYDDGEGYIDLGLDNIYDFDDDGNLVASDDNTWLAINGQPVAYYFLDETEDGDSYTIRGRVPAKLNGERVDLMLVFDNENPYGYILGARTDYDESETGTEAKGLTALNPGDTLEFLCDYYSYDGTYTDSYYLGEPMTVTENMQISNVDVGGETKRTYRLTDIYNQHYWTPEY